MEHKDEIASFLLERNCPITTKGYYYLKSSINYVKKDPLYALYLTKSLYPTVAREFCTEPESVQRCLRTLINMWWKLDALKEMFPKRPTAQQLIVELSERCGMRKNKCCEQYNKEQPWWTHNPDGEYVSVYERLWGLDHFD